MTAGLTALLTNIFERKAEQRNPYVRLVEVGENDTDPAKWGRNWPAQYDGYKRTALPTKTRFGGHGGSEALPEEKIERDPWLKRMFLGYAFSIDYRDRRGHAYMLADQEATERLTKPQSGSCLHCHASIMPLYRQLGGGDAMKGFEQTFKLERTRSSNKKLHESGHAHPVSCVDCHDPKDDGAARDAPGLHPRDPARSPRPTRQLPALPSRRASGARASASKPYDPNVDASRNEMRSFVCGQCHVEYYCGDKMPLTFPWGKGLTRRGHRGVLGRDEVPRRQARSSTTRTRRRARRCSRRSIPSSSSGARASTRGAASRARTATCPTCARARRRSATTGCAARCST